MLYVYDDNGTLTLVEASPAVTNSLRKRVYWKSRRLGPLAFAGGRLLARDLTRMVCLDIGSAEMEEEVKSTVRRRSRTSEDGDRHSRLKTHDHA